MAWVYLVIAGMMEWGWPVGLKYLRMIRAAPDEKAAATTRIV